MDCVLRHDITAKTNTPVHVIMAQLVLRGLKFAKYWLSDFANHYHPAQTSLDYGWERRLGPGAEDLA